MKKNEQPQHTQGESTYSFKKLSTLKRGQEITEGPYRGFLFYEDGITNPLICTVHGIDRLEVDDNMSRIKKAVNMHDELVEALKDVLRDYWAQVDEDLNAGINDLNESLQRATTILKKAEQK